MVKIHKAYFESITMVHRALSEIGLLKGVFLLRDDHLLIDDDNSDKMGTITLSDYSILHIMESEYFYEINRNAKINFDWTEIYLFKDQSLEKYKNIYLPPQKEPIKKSDLLTYFKPQCDFLAASIDGKKLWLTSSAIASTQNIFLSHADKYEEQKDLYFFNMVCNDLLFSA